MLLLIAAVPLETTLLRRQLQSPTTSTLSNYQYLSGRLCSRQVMIAHGGIGQAAMAMQLTRILGSNEFSGVILCGCGGGYPDSGLAVGDLALASAEIFGDLGVAGKNSFLSVEQLEIPQQSEYVPVCREEVTLSPELVNWAGELLPEARIGKFVTVNCCSGTPGLSEQLAHRTGGICENMEGAAAAMVCAEFALPLLELRGISNPTGTRDPLEWDIKRGAEVAQQAVLRLLEHWPAGY